MDRTFVLFTVAILTSASPSLAAGGPAIVSVAAAVETPPLFDDKAGGKANADDPAIWVHPTDPAVSLILGTKKTAGLAVYDLAGRERQSIAPPGAPSAGDSAGRFNNVDVIYGFALGGRRVDLAVVTDRGRDRIRFYAIDPRAARGQAPPLTDVTAAAAPLVFAADAAEVNAQATAYGLAVRGPRRHGPALVFASRRHRAEVATLALEATADGHVTYRRVDTLRLPTTFALPDGTSWSPCEDDDGVAPQVEGMVVDTERDVLYLAQEDVGIWAVPLGDRRRAPRLVDRVREFGVPYDRAPDPAEGGFTCAIRFDRDPGFGGAHLSADAEGLTIYYGAHHRGYLLASSQGDSTFAVYDRNGDNAYLGGFRVADSGAIDGADHSDGAAVINVPLGRAFPRGLFVTQDGDDTPIVRDPGGSPRVVTGFKLVPWEDIASAFACPLAVDPRGHDPRD
jgi:3-phytase